MPPIAAPRLRRRAGGRWAPVLGVLGVLAVLAVLAVVLGGLAAGSSCGGGDGSRRSCGSSLPVSRLKTWIVPSTSSSAARRLVAASTRWHSACASSSASSCAALADASSSFLVIKLSSSVNTRRSAALPSAASSSAWRAACSARFVRYSAAWTFCSKLACSSVSSAWNVGCWPQ